MTFTLELSEDEIAYQAAHLHDTKVPAILATYAVLSVLATIAIVLRVVVRSFTNSKLLADDWTIFIAWVGTYI